MEVHHMGLSISVEDDGDGFPVVRIDTGGGLMDQSGRPAVDVFLNDAHLHRMFGGGDNLHAAAPELLAALKNVCRFERVIQGMNPSVWPVIHAAINRAEGRGE